MIRKIIKNFARGLPGEITPPCFGVGVPPRRYPGKYNAIYFLFYFFYFQPVFIKKNKKNIFLKINNYLPLKHGMPMGQVPRGAPYRTIGIAPPPTPCPGWAGVFVLCTSLLFCKSGSEKRNIKKKSQSIFFNKFNSNWFNQND